MQREIAIKSRFQSNATLTKYRMHTNGKYVAFRSIKPGQSRKDMSAPGGRAVHSVCSPISRDGLCGIKRLITTIYIRPLNILSISVYL
jgi:protocatechuate 3,4-dioxygenase beta subunit